MTKQTVNKNLNAAACESQKKRIKEYLYTGATLTGLEANILFGCLKLPNRIGELIDDGEQIKKERIKVDTQYGPKYVTQYSIWKKPISRKNP